MQQGIQSGMEAGRERKDPLDDGALGPGAHHFGGGARAEQEAQAVDDDRLAGARLAGEQIEPRAELQAQLFDDRQVENREFEQHKRPL